MADGTSTYPRDPIQEEGNYYKKGVEGNRKGGAETPPSPKTTNQRHQEKLLIPCQGPILSGKLSPSQLDREEHRDNRCSYTKT